MRLKRILASLFLLVTVWCLFLLGSFFSIEKPIENLSHIPDNAILAVRLDGASVLKSTLFSILLEANDPEVIEVVNQQINKKWKRKGPSKNLGIDFLADVVVYVFPFEGSKVLGMTYNLNRPDLMRKNAPNALDSNQCYAINDNIGVVLTFLGKTKFGVGQKVKAINLAQKIAFESVQSDLASKIAEKQTNRFVQLTSQGMLFGSSTLFSRTDMDLSLEEHTLLLKGQLIKNRRERKVFVNKNYTLNPSGMHMYTTLIPISVQDSIKNILKRVKLNLPQIKAIAVNYRSLQINNPNGVIIPSPDMDLVLNFDRNVDFIEELKKSTLLKDLHLEIKNNNIIFNGLTNYYLTQIDPKTILISTHKSTKAKLVNADQLLNLKGDLSRFTEVSGDKWIMLFLNNVPLFTNTQNFFSKTKELSLKVIDSEDNAARLQGKLVFHDEYSPMNEFFKYAIQSNIIRLK